MPKPDDVILKSDLKTIINLFTSNGGYGLSECRFSKITSYPYLIKCGDLTRKTKEASLTEKDPITYDVSTIVFVNSNLLINHENTLLSFCDWAELIFLKEPSTFSPVFFSTRLFQLFKSDPIFLLDWKDYRTDVYSYDTKPPINITIKHLCLAHDNIAHEPILMLFIGDLIKLGKIEKGLLRPFLLESSTNYKLYKQNILNLVEGIEYGGEFESIYEIIITGIRIINKITEKKFKFRLYNSEERPFLFRSIVYPTKYNYEDYLIDVAKILVDNINANGLRKYLWKNREHFKDTDVGNEMISRNPQIFENDFDFKEVRSISLLELFISDYKYRFLMIQFIKNDIWEKRNTISHCSSNPDEYNQSYYNMQDKMNKKLYKTILGIIDFIDPDRCECNNIEQYQYLINQFSKKGTLTNLCGWNTYDI